MNRVVEPEPEPLDVAPGDYGMESSRLAHAQADPKGIPEFGREAARVFVGTSVGGGQAMQELDSRPGEPKSYHHSGK